MSDASGTAEGAPATGAPGATVLLVPDLALERWPSMDRYAAALVRHLPHLTVPREAAALRGPRYLARYVRYPRALRRRRPRAVHVADHSYAHCLAAFPGVPSVVTIHDLYPVHVLRQAGRSPRAWLRDLVLRGVLAWLRRADLVIADNGFVAGEVTGLLGIAADRIRIGGLGVDEAFFAAGATGRREGRTRTILHVGSCVPRKNVEAVIATLAELRRRGRDVALLQLGGRFTAAQRAAIERAGLAGRVAQEPAVSDERLVAAYRSSDVLLFPSHYEGFGLPVIEALAAGLPVVSSGVGGLAEAGGDQAVIVQPPEPARLADAVERLLDAPGGDAAREARRAWARRFTWQAVADAHQRVYDELLGRR